MEIHGKSDPELVEACCAGNMEAFEQIVKRYQTLICSIAYSATGDLGRSEDLAQETFILAWRNLKGLRDISKLRSWLCAIARNLVRSSRRKERREPTVRAVALEGAPEGQATEPSPREQAISKEEAAILWRALERIPKAYREPMVLYYREGQSTQKVAEMLELSPGVVRQRLSRGCGLLKAEVASFVEELLRRSAPKKAFTIAVLAALPAAVTKKAVAASVLVPAGKAAKSAVAAGAAVGTIGGVLGTVFGFLGGLFGIWRDYKRVESPKEKKFVLLAGGIVIAYTGLFIILAFKIPSLAKAWGLSHWDLTGGWIGLYVGGLSMWMVWGQKRLSRIRLEAQGIDVAKVQPPLLVKEKWKRGLKEEPPESPGRAAARILLGIILVGGFIALWILLDYGILKVSQQILWMGAALALGGYFAWREGTNRRYPPRYRRFLLMACVALTLFIEVFLVAVSYWRPRGNWGLAIVILYSIGLLGLIALIGIRTHQLQKREGLYKQRAKEPVAAVGEPIRLSRQKVVVEQYLRFTGAVSWMIIIALMVGDWGTIAVVFAATLIIPILTLRAFAPHYWRIAFYDVLGAAILTLVVVNLRWFSWMEKYRQTRFYESVNDLPLWLIDALLIVLFSFFLIFFAVKDRKQRAMLESHNNKEGGYK